MVTEEAGLVLLMVRLLHTANVPALTEGIKEMPDALEMTTSVEDVGTPLHQLVDVAQSLLVAPIQPPLPRTVTLQAAD